MKRIFLFIAVLLVGGLAAAYGDDNVRAAQSRLKADGFYFGEANGEYNSETAAAVSRYQIRNGLPISGQLDAETTKALGVQPLGSATVAPSNSSAWKRLRRTDQRFLQRLNRAGAAKKGASTSAPSSAAAPPPSDDTGPTTLVLSRERLRDYVAAFVLAGLDSNIGAELEFFGDHVNYFGDANATREKIRRDLQRYAGQWPERRFWLAGQLEVAPQADSRIRVTFPLRFDLQNGAKHKSGKVMKTLLLEVVGEDLEIVAVNERKA